MCPIQAMALKTGYYFPYAFDLDKRPIGAEQIPNNPNEQVVRPHITLEHKENDDVLMFPNACWDCVISYSGTSKMLKYMITSDDRPVENINDDVQVIIPPCVPAPFFWEIFAEIHALPPPESLYG